jgi:polysaccharide pyruvyl transferase WcaK-like protein
MDKKKILFLGTHGQYNIGDELLLETFLIQLGENHSYMINSYDPEFTRDQLSGKYDVEVFHTTEDKWQLPQRIWQSDLLFFGGGSVLKELYASVGRNRYATLIMVLFIVLFANIIARKPIVMSNIGVGPIHTPLGLLLVKLILWQVAFVSVRDERSYDTCLQVGISEQKIKQVPDAVFVTDPESLPQEQNGDQSERETLKVALNLNYDIENPENWENFLSNLASALVIIGGERNLEIHALPMQSRFKENNDYEVLKSFKDQLPGLNVVMHEPATANDIAKIVGQCDIVVAERLHALVLSSILQRPFVALVYDVKVEQLAHFLKMDSMAININHPFEVGELVANISKAVEDKQTIVDHLSDQVAQAAKDLRQYFSSVNQQFVSN